MHGVFSLLNESEEVKLDFGFCLNNINRQLFANKSSVYFPFEDTGPLNEQVLFFFHLCLSLL